MYFFAAAYASLREARRFDQANAHFLCSDTFDSDSGRDLRFPRTASADECANC